MVRAGILTGMAGALALFAPTPACRAAGADDHLVLCAHRPETALCEADRAEFRQAFAAAHRGDYQGQRNVAFCLETGCHGAVRPNPTLACAWRTVILLSGSPRVDGTDRSNHRLACGRLDRLDIATAEAQAKRIQASLRP